MKSFIETRPEPDEQLEMIADATRRRLLVDLLEDGASDTPIKISRRTREIESADRIEMQHVHLPKLEDCGYVRWDRERQFVERGPQFTEIEPLLTLLHDHADELPEEWL